MLVSESIVHRWYKKDHWMYKQFSFLFSNPLYKKKVPGGFSVCPYFWFSMVSFFLAKPMIYLLFGIIMAISFTYENTIGRIRSVPENVKLGTVVVLACIAAAYVVFLVLEGAFTYWGPIFTVAILGGIPLTGFCAVKSDELSKKGSSCWPMMYPIVFLIGCLVCIYRFDKPSWGVFTSGYISVAGWIVEIIRDIFTYFGSIVSAVWNFLFHTASPFFSLNWGISILLLMGSLSVIGYICMKIEEYFANKRSKITNLQYWDEYVHHDLVHRIERWYINELRSHDTYDLVPQRTLQLCAQSLADKWVTKLWNENKPCFEKAFPVLPGSREAITDTLPHGINVDYYCWDELKRIQEEMAALSVQLFKQQVEKDKARAATTSKRTKSLDRWCTIITGGIGRCVKRVNLEAKTCFVYGKTLIKARKQGWCPYIRFQDEKKDESN